MSFTRQPNERADALLSRFLAIRFRASQGGAGQNMTMLWEGYAWLLLKAHGINGSQPLNLLQLFQGHMPTSEAEFNAMQMSLRRMGHILEHQPGNIASQLRAPPAGGFSGMALPGDTGQQSAYEDPWLDPSSDPWAPPGAAQAATGAPPAWQKQQHNLSPTQPQHGSPAPGSYYAPTHTAISDTDSDTISSFCEPLNYQDDEDLQLLEPAGLNEHLTFVLNLSTSQKPLAQAYAKASPQSSKVPQEKRNRPLKRQRSYHVLGRLQRERLRSSFLWQWQREAQRRRKTIQRQRRGEEK